MQWDDESFTDMRPCECRGACSEIEELITKLDKTAGEMMIRDFEMVDEKDALVMMMMMIMIMMDINMICGKQMHMPSYYASRS